MTDKQVGIFKTILYLAGYTNNLDTSANLDVWMKYSELMMDYPILTDEAKGIMNNIIAHDLTAASISEFAKNISLLLIDTHHVLGTFVYTTAGSNQPSVLDKHDVSAIIDAIAAFSVDNDIYWNDFNLDMLDVDVDMAQTAELIRRTLAANKLLYTQNMGSGNAPTSGTTNNTTATTNANTNATGITKGSINLTNPTKSQGGKNPYKTLGAQSSNIPSTVMLGTPGNPDKLNTTFYYITADKLPGKTNAPVVFVKPVEEPRAGKKAVIQNGALALQFGSGNDYTDLQCFWDSQAAAQKVCADLSTAPKIAKYPNLRVESKHINGKFYKVKTSGGDVYISTRKLNEDVDDVEIIDESAETISDEARAKTFDRYNAAIADNILADSYFN